MMRKGLLSICCLGYNHAKFIEACLQGIFDSKYDNVEIIAVDDGSSDESRDVLKQAVKKSKYPIQLILQENTGNLAKNFNRGIARATGEFITFVSLDDVLNMEQVDSAVSEMKTDETLAFAASTNFDIIDADGNVTENRKLPIHENFNASAADMLEFEYSRFESFWLQGTVFRRKIIDAVDGFDEDMRADDIVLRTKVLRYVNEHGDCSFLLSKNKSFQYRLHGNNISGNTFRQIKSITEYLDRYWPDRPNPKIYNEWLSYAIKVYDTNIAKELLIQNERISKALEDDSVFSEIFLKTKQKFLDYAARHGRCQLYFDAGNDFNESESMTACYLTCEKADVEFDLSGQDCIKAVRFDPADYSGRMRSFEAAVHYKNGETRAVADNEIVCGAALKIDGEYVFCGDDPNVFFAGVDFSNVSRITISFVWENGVGDVCKNVWDKSESQKTEIESFRGQLQSEKKQNECLMAEIEREKALTESLRVEIEREKALTESLRVEIERERNCVAALQTDIEQKNLQAELLQKEIDSLHNSTSWRLTKPVRVVGRLVRRFARH